MDGTNVGGLDTSSPYGASWNTTQIADGQHTITAHGYNAAGNMSTTTTNVIVHNGAACVEDWLSIPCSAWSACSNGTQTRTCTDANNCGTTNNRPALTQSCTAPDTTAPAAVQNLQAS